jgi:hypothetical protein
MPPKAVRIYTQLSEPRFTGLTDLPDLRIYLPNIAQGRPQGFAPTNTQTTQNRPFSPKKQHRTLAKPFKSLLPFLKVKATAFRR